MPTGHIKTIAIISKPRSEQATRLVPALVEWLAQRGIAVRIDTDTAVYLNQKGGLSREAVTEGAHLLVVLGGDGTLLSAARALGGRDIPILAVNLGNLGFLTAITADEIYPQLEQVLTGEYSTGRRGMLHTEIWRGDVCAASFEALNDVALAKVEIARIIDLHVHVDGHFMCVYKGDGLIISTPTGSTAYNLSAGGPIILPTVAAFCITPICPHMLSHRPVIVPEQSVVQVTLPGEDDSTYLTVDGQVGELLKSGDRVVCRRSEHFVRLIQPPDLVYFDMLREKLKWGGR